MFQLLFPDQAPAFLTHFLAVDIAVWLILGFIGSAVFHAAIETIHADATNRYEITIVSLAGYIFGASSGICILAIATCFIAIAGIHLAFRRRGPARPIIALGFQIRIVERSATAEQWGSL